jgi:hypothetical protein
MIVAHPNLAEFFEEAVQESLQACRVEATPPTASYLVMVLEDFTKPDRTKETLDRPLSLLLDEALHAPIGERFERLRTLGDGVLYASGFFGDHFQRRGVSAGYLYGIGTRAYGNASAMLGATDDGLDVFGELARKFDVFAGVFADVADQTAAMSAAGSTGVLKLYERWLRTGSERIAEALNERGLSPTRLTKGLH